MTQGRMQRLAGLLRGRLDLMKKCTLLAGFRFLNFSPPQFRRNEFQFLQTGFHFRLSEFQFRLNETQHHQCDTQSCVNKFHFCCSKTTWHIRTIYRSRIVRASWEDQDWQSLASNLGINRRTAKEWLIESQEFPKREGESISKETTLATQKVISGIEEDATL